MGFLMLSMLFPIFIVGVVAWLIHSAIQAKRLPEGTAEELKRLQGQVEEMASRLHRIEEEREFDRRLLDAAVERKELPGQTGSQ